MSWSDNKLISLNSKFATKLNGSSLSNVVFPFSGILKDESNMKHVYISVMSAQFPVSFYVINSTNNVLKSCFRNNLFRLYIDFNLWKL